ncbi:hypothetical protein KXD93_04715 [Mucilaginibacter sp. BJC16-A38]|uniref:hypothetical protein n=1 Tax=Mucilaginibacter phenanthrenivorans TaxID=1234842 RepID=UPI002157E085|nr:hypothetical protein [Mucilaginibacter phenanthrenivorans]MCR8556928.1 hypothetical protein [Mucilaginibacter phenanthrenivorans]
MKKNRLLHLMICTLGGVSCIVLLWGFSVWRTRHPNGFLRKQPSHKIYGTGFIKLPDQQHYIAGIDSQFVYLGSKTLRARLLCVKPGTKDSSTVLIRPSDTLRFNEDAAVRICGNEYFIFDGSRGQVITGDIHSGLQSRDQRVPYFLDGLPLTNSIVIAKLLTKGRKSALVTLNGGVVSHSYLLPQQGDGIFMPDGVIVSPPDGKRLIYVYYYCNRFLCFDQCLKLTYKANTIDTVTHPHIRVAENKSNGDISLASPAVFVNKHCATNGSYLFIHSTLKADNETDVTHGRASAIDIYRVDNGRYIYTIYLPDLDGYKLRDLRVCGSTMVALFGPYVYYYQLDF